MREFHIFIQFINLQDIQGNTALLYAVFKGNYDIVKTLIDNQEYANDPDLKNLNDEDKDLLYKAVEQICGPVSDSDASKKAVASTILNRVLSAEFPNTVKGVVEQSGQYPNRLL